MSTNKERLIAALQEPLETTLTRYKTHLDGLKEDQVEENRDLYGENVITKGQEDSIIKKIYESIINPFTVILLVIALVSFITNVWLAKPGEEDPTTSIIIVTLVLISGGIRFIQELRSDKAASNLSRMIVNTATVLRDGSEQEIPIDEIVVGDVVKLSAGDMIPADVVLLDSRDFFVQQSGLTGESDAVEKACLAKADGQNLESLLESESLAFMGTNVISGRATALVLVVGDETMMGAIEQTINTYDEPTSFEREMNSISWLLIRLMLVMVPVVFVIIGLTDGDWLEAGVFALSVGVGLTPEMLPMIITASLAKGSIIMAKEKVVIKKLNAIQDLGAIDILCTDKTGTLTHNQMQVYQTRFYGLPDQELQQDNRLQVLIKEGISINSTAYLEYGNDQIKTLGNPTEAALLLWLHQQKINYMDYRDNTEILEQLTFSTERKYMATLVRSVLEGKLILYLKGAPEIVFAKCKQVETPAGLVPAQEYHATVEKELLDFQNQAMRTLGFAYKLVDSASEGEIEAIAQEDFIFLGIAAISDPVRPDVPAAVAKCLNAGIDVKIVTGDTPATAREIGRQIGIWKSEDSEEQIITGVDFEKLPDEEAAKRVLKLKIMCRARPTDKQRLVELLKQSGAVVAVTGDGTNDAPALNHADVGLSMGSGTSVAKEASDITLLDDSFNSIATAVMWGRSLYHNIQRFILFQLTINLSALLIVLIGSMFGRELPLTVTQMLWVNMIIDTFAAAALASLPPNPKVMNEMPRKSTDFIISPKMRNYILGIGLSFTVLLLGLMYWFTINDGVMSRHDLSVFFTTFVMLQFWNMFNAKAFLSHGSAFKNLKDSTGFLIVMFIIPIGQYLIVQFGGEVFRTVPLSWKDWGIIVGLTSPVLFIGEILRLMKKQ